MNSFSLTGLTKNLEETMMNDKFAITVSHVKLRKKSSNNIETFFAAKYLNSKTKFVLMLDRRSKRGKLIVCKKDYKKKKIKQHGFFFSVIVEEVEDNQPRRQHLIADSLSITEPFKSIIFVVHQRREESAKIEVYVDCVLQGEIILKKSLREMSLKAGNLPLEVVRLMRLILFIFFFFTFSRKLMYVGIVMYSALFDKCLRNEQRAVTLIWILKYFLVFCKTFFFFWTWLMIHRREEKTKLYHLKKKIFVTFVCLST